MSIRERFSKIKVDMCCKQQGVSGIYSSGSQTAKL